MSGCPTWCMSLASGDPCRGEHFDDKAFVPATATRPTIVSAETGASFPVLGVGLDWSEVDGEAGPALVLWSTGIGDDREVFLRPREAEQLVKELQARLKLLARH